MIGILYRIVPFSECRQLNVSIVIILTCSALYIMLCDYKGTTYFIWDSSSCYHPVILIQWLQTANLQPPVQLLQQ